MTRERKALLALCRTSFGAFVFKAFEVLHPGQVLDKSWHIDCIANLVQQMAEGQATNRLVLNLPPRTLKSTIVSVCLPAWLLGQDPSKRIICASYADELARKFSRDFRMLMESAFYRAVFPGTRLNPKKMTETEIETTAAGFRLATSVGGTLTGRGGDCIIVDDPLKALDAGSEVARTRVVEWFNNSLMTRLDDHQRGLTIVTMQRLHEDDLAGVLIEKEWPSLLIPLIATQRASYRLGPRESDVHHRPAGDILMPDRFPTSVIAQLRHDLGSAAFAAQYQQEPVPAEGNWVQAAWLTSYEPGWTRDKCREVIITCDPAGKAGPNNDYTAITVWARMKTEYWLLAVQRGHWGILEMETRIETLAREYSATLIVIEDMAAGMSLIPQLRQYPSLHVKDFRPHADKQTRLSCHLSRFEAGKIRLPQEAPWLADYKHELLSFPSGRYDDQVDSTLMFLDWVHEREKIEPPLWVYSVRPISVECESYWRR